jgi:hypothetical protein
VDDSVRTISAWEQTALNKRTRAQQVGDWITATVASGPVLLLHVLWFQEPDISALTQKLDRTPEEQEAACESGTVAGES